MQSINGYFVDYASLKFMSGKHTVCQKSQFKFQWMVQM